jgi:hypothetical protein
MLVASIAVATTNQAAVITYFWEQSGSNVLLTLSGSVDVTGWSTDSNTSGSATAYFGNEGMDDQILMVRSPSTGSRAYNSNAGLIVSPWGTGEPIGASLNGAFVSGSFSGIINVSNIGSSAGVSAYLQSASISDNIYSLDAVYRFSNTTLTEMFGDGLAAWSGGATIATLGSNDIVFTTQVVPEPATTALFIGGVAVFALLRRKRN